MNKSAAILTSVIFFLMVCAITYFAIQNQKLTNQLTNNPQTQSTSFPTIMPTATPVNSASSSSKNLTIADIHQIIDTNTNQKNHSGLLPYLKNKDVAFIIMSSGCCAPKTPQEAIDGLKYIDEGIPFDFDQNSSTVKEVRVKNIRLTNAYIGISKNSEKLIAFTLDSKYQISQIEVSASWKLY